MDQHKLRSLVFEKTGVKVDVDDPIFALVALNEAVLAEAVERHIERIDAASLELAQQARLAAGALPPAAPSVSEFEPAASSVAAPVSSSASSAASSATAAPAYVPTPAAPVKPIATQSVVLPPREQRVIAIAAGAAVLGAVLTLIGQALFFRPAATAPVTVPAPLSAAQIEALATARKLDRALPRLDAKTRAAVLAEMQKP